MKKKIYLNPNSSKGNIVTEIFINNSGGNIMEVVDIYGLNFQSNTKIPLYSMSVSAGVPIPVDNDIDSTIDLNEFLIRHPATTFFAHVTGDNLEESGIYDGDILIVDTSMKPRDGNIVVVELRNNLSVKIYREFNEQVYLQTDKEHFLPMKIDKDFEFNVIGIVNKVIHSI